MPNKFKRLKAGDPLSVSRLFDPLMDAAEGAEVQAGAGLELQRTSAGQFVRSLGKFPRLVKVTGAIAPGSTSAPTQGSGTLKTFDGTSYGDTTVSLVIYNRWDKTVADAAQVVVDAMFGGYWFIVDPRSCNDVT